MKGKLVNKASVDLLSKFKSEKEMFAKTQRRGCKQTKQLRSQHVKGSRLWELFLSAIIRRNVGIQSSQVVPKVGQ